MGQKRPKLLRLPAAKSATKGLGKIVPITDSHRSPSAGFKPTDPALSFE
jgi:hypothetical protein